jgi:carboxyl-terminal processing protease
LGNGEFGHGAGRLGRILSDCREILARRERSRRRDYLLRIRPLEQFRDPEGEGSDAEAILEVLKEAARYAGERQRALMLEDPLAAWAVEAAAEAAERLESEGRYYGAYIEYVRPLMDITGDDTYRSWAEALLQKAEIAAALRDVPCSGADPFAGASARVLKGSLKTLDSAYVSIVDYAEMSDGGLARCLMLCEVLTDTDIAAHGSGRLRDFSGRLADLKREVESLDEVDKRLFTDVLDRVLELNGLCRGGCVAEELLVAQFAAGALSRLDPYTTIYWPNQVHGLRRAVTNEFGGVGIKLSARKGWVEIVEVLPDSPACEAGLQAGDLITAVDGMSLEGLSGSCTAGVITGPVGTDVVLSITRSGWGTEEEIVLERAFIRAASVFGWRADPSGGWLHMIDRTNGIGYIRVGSFDSRTFGEFRQALDALVFEGLGALIIDLRGNLGGVLDCAVKIADTFVTEGLIIRTQPRCGMPTYISAGGDNTLSGCPVVVLIDRHTASAAEIVAGVLSDPKYRRAVLIGERSYGKGSVQAITTTIGGGARLKYTGAFYHMPSGKRVISRYEARGEGDTEWGMAPQVEIDLTDAEFERVRKWWRNVGAAGAECGDRDHAEQYSIQDIIDADPQLAIALLAAEGMIVEQDAEQLLAAR